jgi:hypothetical protein
VIDYPFAERFDGHGFLAQGQALRVQRFDTEVRRFVAANPDGTVVALGEGLETQFWRVDNGRVHWVTVELPADKRRRLGAERLRLPRGRGIFFGYLAPLLRLGVVEILRARFGSA